MLGAFWFPNITQEFKMKKVLALIALAFTLSATVGCGEEKKTTPATNANAKASSTAAPETKKTP
jgi:hypothetical protein